MFTKAVQTFRRHASRPIGRTLLFCLAAMVLLAIAFRIVTPFLISTTTVKESMEEAVADWTGHGATIGGVSTIRFWPRPEVTISDIVIHRDEPEGRQVLATIDGLSASFELTEALLGRPVFRDFQLVNPHAFVSYGTDGRFHWAKDGRLIDAISKSTGRGTSQLLESGLDAPIGEVQVTNGVIEVVREIDGRTARFDAINGTIDWPRLSEPLDIDGEAVFRGRRVNLDIRTSQPLLLLDGRSGHFQGTANTDIGNARFNGIASIAPGGYFSGNAEWQASDMAAMMRWFEINPALVDGLTSASVAARVIADKSELRLEDLSLELNNESATGLLELDTPSEGQPRLSGTMAFDHIDALRLLVAMEPAIGADTDGIPSLFSGLGLDLRLSSQSATFGPVRMSDVALGILNVSRQFRMDILDGNLNPGRVTGRISTLKDDGHDSIALRLAVRGADFASLAQQFNLAGPRLAAQGTLDLSLEVPRPLDHNTWHAAKGTAQFVSGAGRLDGIDLAAIRRLASEKAYFTLGEATNGSIEFESIKANAVVGDGIADIQNAEIKGVNNTISLSGAIPLINRSVALAAIVTPNAATDQALRFFVGGAWPSPVLWPTRAPIAKPGE